MAHYDDIEQILGDSTNRYFGHGYLNTRQSLNEITIVPRDSEIVDFSGSGRITMPEIWSMKGTSVQRPHMSSIDAIELARLIVSRISDSLKVPNFAGHQLTRIEVTGGTTPLEEDLDRISISGEATQVDPDGGIAIRAMIGNMKLRISLRGSSNTQKIEMVSQSQKISIKDLIIVPSSHSAAAIMYPPNGSVPLLWSLASCFASSLQLGQVLLYDLDKLDRASSNTLWMRKFTISINESMATQDGPQPIYAALKKIKLLDQGAETWRCADIHTILCGINLTCSVAHMLPDDLTVAKVA